MANNIIKLNKGSDFLATIIWGDESGSAVDLSGYTIAVYDADDYIASNMSATITDAASGEITLSMQWSDDMRIGKDQHCFRLRLTQGTYDVSTNRLFFEVT